VRDWPGRVPAHRVRQSLPDETGDMPARAETRLERRAELKVRVSKERTRIRVRFL
jgi:hypothetical protein